MRRTRKSSPLLTLLIALAFMAGGLTLCAQPGWFTGGVVIMAFGLALAARSLYLHLMQGLETATQINLLHESRILSGDYGAARLAVLKDRFVQALIEARRGLFLGILEGKSINPKGAWEVRSCPKLDHVVQAQCYMWLTGLQWAKLVYWDKAGMGLSALIEHTVERDEETIDTVKSILKEIWSGVRFEAERLPARICERRDAPRAESCAIADKCFMVDE